MLGFNDSDIQAALNAAGTPDGKNGAGMIGAGQKAAVIVRFYMHATIDGDATQKAGRPIYREQQYVELRPKGDDGRFESISHAVTETDRREYPHEWAAFERHQQTPMHSVMSLPGFTASDFRYCDDAQLFTIEALAAAAVQPELERLKATAVRWLEFATWKPSDTLPVSVVEADEALMLSAPTPDVDAYGAMREKLLEELRGELAMPKKRGGRKLGSKNKPKVGHGEVA